MADSNALAAEFNEAEKAATEEDPSKTLADDDELAPKGSICEAKEIFDTKTSSCSCCTEWVDEKPERDRTEQSEAAESRRAQFSVIRRLTPHGAGGWRTHSILINSRSIQEALAKVFVGYPVTYSDDHNLELTHKFIPFLHRWDKLLEVEQDEPDAETKRHLTLLRSTLEIDLADNLKRRNLVARTGLASFPDMELLFEPGQVVICERSDGIMTAGVTREVTLEPSTIWSARHYLVDVDTTAWDGKRFGVEQKEWRLDDFSGTRKVHSLDIYPLHMHPDHEKIPRELIDRGKKYERLRGQHFVAYTGETRSENVRERVIIDADFYYQSSDDERPRLKPFKESSTGGAILDEENSANNDNGIGNTANGEDAYHSHAGSAHSAPLTNDQLLLASWSITAFRLKTKVWSDLAVEKILEIDWIPDLMPRLVLDPDIKDLIVALIDYKTTQATDEQQTFDDFIPGKGKGIVMVLCGPPGVWKTLTAEAVSEHSKRPLYRINMNDLGGCVSDVERGLEIATKRCSQWNAALLLDEADVFLEQRSVNSLERNELLEYYEGVMILTMNRAASIDPAFESRIDVTLTFEALTKEARRRIWDGFLRETTHPA
ncbi:hypothetical protein INS49_004894 [Diaporthe citri]|uniref:uncharacterized protein n=1 Tax=Diaporthe citri TaxID=83186 RepID=UPI001C8004CA|nr:uncharacterized protein INS49_004894 [Diaporthe citri]KAG6354289.1 hypothetical protein INS49_004894 [Diaporthe citri]